MYTLRRALTLLPLVVTVAATAQQRAEPCRPTKQLDGAPVLLERSLRAMRVPRDSVLQFRSMAGNEQNILHFYNDIEMYTDNPTTPFPVSYMLSWYAGPEGANVPQKANGWSQLNYGRYNNPE